MSQAEKVLDRLYLVPDGISDVWGPQPQGIVDENCPWLHVLVPMYEESDINSVRKAKVARLKYKRRFYFELSQDPSFKSNVYRSGPKRWSFYNPYRHLEKGKWYWKYGVADPDTPDKPVWNDEVYCFEITGKEFMVPIPPTPEEFVNTIISRPAPTYTLLWEEYGKLLPTETWPEMVDFAVPWYEKKYQSDNPMSFTVNDQTAIDAGYVDAQGNITAKPLFYTQKIRTLTGQLGRYISDLIAGYLLTGEIKYRDRAIQKSRDADEFIRNASFRINHLDTTFYIVDRENGYSMNQFIDICPEGLTQAEIDTIVKQEYPGTWTPPEDFESAEHSIYDQHLWQEIQNKFKRPMMFARYHEEAREELKYAYELWLFRAPSLGRNDGGSLEGDGYMGVHDNYLGAIPWMLYKTMGYNNFAASRWFQNMGKYLTYINPLSAEQAAVIATVTVVGATMPYSIETMAHLVPDNYWNLWRFKTIPRQAANKFTSDLGKGDKAYTLLSLWNYMPLPDTTGLEAPKELAALFRDIGEVGMHTDLGNVENNLQVTLHSSPYGSLMHTHPCQNAFNLAYGGQDLFWKTGFYNGGGWHNLLSYKCSRAHNTIMADGQVQGFHQTAPRMDAQICSRRQDQLCSRRCPAKALIEEKQISRRECQSDIIRLQIRIQESRCRKFRRHLVMLRPNHVLICNRTGGPKSRTWEFRLHSDDG